MSITLFCVDTSHLKGVLDQLKGFPKHRWMEFGLECGLHQNTLKLIEANYPKDASTCFTECVDRWLKKEDDVDKSGEPTPQRLVEIRSKLDKEGQ